MCRDLVALRLAGGPRPGPFLGDGLHVFHNMGGVIAYLRWTEARDSRDAEVAGADLALVVVNCTNNSYPCYELGVPPSKAWTLMLSTDTLLRGNLMPASPLVLAAQQGMPNSGFPCILNLSLQPYSAIILLKHS